MSHMQAEPRECEIRDFIREMATQAGLDCPRVKPSVARVRALDVDGEHLRAALEAAFEVGEQSLVGEVARVRVLPVSSGNFVESLHDLVVAPFDRKLATS